MLGWEVGCSHKTVFNRAGSFTISLTIMLSENIRFILKFCRKIQLSTGWVTMALWKSCGLAWALFCGHRGPGQHLCKATDTMNFCRESAMGRLRALRTIVRQIGCTALNLVPLRRLWKKVKFQECSFEMLGLVKTNKHVVSNTNFKTQNIILLFTYDIVYTNIKLVLFLIKLNLFLLKFNIGCIS